MTRRFKSIVLSLLMFFSFSSVFAVEEYVSKLYKDIDKVFADKSEDDLNSLLQKNQGDRYYYLLENYAEKKIRLLIINDDYIFAMAAIEVVIENNLDNEEAIEMYALISDSYENQLKTIKYQEEIKIKQTEKLEQEKQNLKGKVQKNYVVSSSASGDAVYLSGIPTNGSLNTISGHFGVIDLTNFYIQATNQIGFNYGISFDWGYERDLKNNLIFGIDGTGKLSFLTLGNSETGIPALMELSVVPKLAFKNVSDKMFLRFGALANFMANISIDPETQESKASITRFLSPVLGVSLDNVSFGNIKFNMGVDYYAGHMFYKDILFSCGGNTALFFPLTKTDKMRMDLEVGLTDKMFLKTNGIENRASLIIAIGAESVK